MSIFCHRGAAQSHHFHTTRSHPQLVEEFKDKVTVRPQVGRTVTCGEKSATGAPLSTGTDLILKQELPLRGASRDFPVAGR